MLLVLDLDLFSSIFRILEKLLVYIAVNMLKPVKRLIKHDHGKLQLVCYEHHNGEDDADDNFSFSSICFCGSQILPQIVWRFFRSHHFALFVLGVNLYGALHVLLRLKSDEYAANWRIILLLLVNFVFNFSNFFEVFALDGQAPRLERCDHLLIVKDRIFSQDLDFIRSKNGKSMFQPLEEDFAAWQAWFIILLMFLVVLFKLFPLLFVKVLKYHVVTWCDRIIIVLLGDKLNVLFAVNPEESDK